MSEYVGPVPRPALDATAPEIYRRYYGMPMFVTVPTRELAASKDFWIRGLGFIDLFSIPDRLTHLRRWAFQDVLLTPGVATETDALNADLAAAKRTGVAPGSAEANTLAERHRALLSRYYDCTHSMQVCLGRTFVGDPGFATRTPQRRQARRETLGRGLRSRAGGSEAVAEGI